MTEETSVEVVTPVPAPVVKRVLNEEEQKKLAVQVNVYIGIDIKLKKVEKAKEVLSGQRNLAVKEILEEFGRGPHPTPYGELLIVNRGETYFFKRPLIRKEP